MPPGISAYERLQFVRNTFLDRVIAANPGSPVDVPPSRVQAMLLGGDATPYEITAAEALLARWAGIPSRIGYGYYGGDKTQGAASTYSIRPRDGAEWLESYFEGVGWVPILGHPPKAKSSLDQKQKNQQKAVATDQLTAQVYIPLSLQTNQLFYSLVQFYLERVVPLLLGLVLLVTLVPLTAKNLRRVRRRRWARARGPRQRIAVAYAELRDRCIDLNLGHPSLTPIELLAVLAPDEDHDDLAWLTTRAIWGDLRRDLRAQDAEIAEVLAASIKRRLSAGQPVVMRTVAAMSRVSLRSPWSVDLPNLWWQPQLRKSVGRQAAALRRHLTSFNPVRRLSARPGIAAGVSLLLLLTLGGCAQTINLAAAGATPALPRVPDSLAGFTFQVAPGGSAAFAKAPSNALTSAGQVWSIRNGGGTAVGTIQEAVFKPGLGGRLAEVRKGVLDSLGSAVKVERLGDQVVYTTVAPQAQLLVWFSSDAKTYELLVANITQFPDPGALFAQLLTAQAGQDPARAGGGQPPVDPRLGTP